MYKGIDGTDVPISRKQKKILMARAQRAASLSQYETVKLTRRNIGLLCPWNKKMVELVCGKGIEYEKGKRELRGKEISRETFVQVFLSSYTYKVMTDV